MKKLLFLLIVVAGIGGLVFGVREVWADECDKSPSQLNSYDVIEMCKNRISSEFDAISRANTTNKKTLADLQKRVANLQAAVGLLEKNILDKEGQIALQEKAFSNQYERLAATARSYYIRSRAELGLEILLTSGDIKGAVTTMGLLSAITRKDRETISGITETIRGLEEQKSELGKQKASLEVVKKSVDEKAQFYAAEVAKASAYESALSGKIASLTARQQALLAEKTGTYQTSVGDVPLADDPNARATYDPGFRPAFAGFSFGAPHFKGMSQYGAFGRAKNGQNYKDILAAYYGNVEVRKMSMPGSIRTSVGTMPFEGQYLRGIAEMPTVWADQSGYEALKAQAVAARSYALAYVGWRMNNQNASGSICTTEACQVYSGSKAGSPGKWGDAVRDTEGEILVSRSSGEVVNAWYASTSGGYQESYTSLGHTTPGFWDTTSDWTRWADGAWEKVGGSPWFYKGWYKSRSGASCGRSHPWLNESEFADIVNAALVYANGGDVSGLFPEDVRSCYGGSDNPWSKDRMAVEADKYGGRVTSVSNVSVEHGNNGVTNKVIFLTNRGEITISGTSFYKAFNLRAPGAIHLTSGLFNVEKK